MPSYATADMSFLTEEDRAVVQAQQTLISRRSIVNNPVDTSGTHDELLAKMMARQHQIRAIHESQAGQISRA
ncbi:TPA: hypothetical protein P2N00_004324 [Aeromonas salmonicida]|uniref:Uncharacterized protein n=1 Tax=Aeromonas salmonicida (strain A449) TaxID=382245 RepID=A4SUK7_AERS4|nr:hypothetical protein [Aeromonas salmonicida]ABO92579.1 hypothetical protein ASA_P5G109 [Aeromonas salmonicida subsp. salmonicida A449]EKP0241593.1 hypothetical protein [Aeromonas salmonicida]EKP0245682.1 hypothetical protein [Aeromonas salmonicida]EKP0254278.1 hypothetical protein [Aeromonas salmonicida]EKP0258459.1 hypothetical protein [Aeromonas salmonicida]